MTVYIGTAGWSIRREQTVLFGAGESHLARYATRFNAAEINSSFYRPHQHKTYQRWAASVPENFRFAVKLPRAITHDARLAQVDDALDAFQAQVSGLGRKLGPVLVQLPPSLKFDAAIAPRFFKSLRAKFESALACEPRHASWFGEAAGALLKKYRVARVAADPAPVPGADKPGGWGSNSQEKCEAQRNGFPSGRATKNEGYSYFRWHGSPVMYHSDYSPERLTALAGCLRDGDWCIFDNTADGAAAPDALALTDMS